MVAHQAHKLPWTWRRFRPRPPGMEHFHFTILSSTHPAVVSKPLTPSPTTTKRSENIQQQSNKQRRLMAMLWDALKVLWLGGGARGDVFKERPQTPALVMMSSIKLSLGQWIILSGLKLVGGLGWGRHKLWWFDDSQSSPQSSQIVSEPHQSPVDPSRPYNTHRPITVGHGFYWRAWDERTFNWSV